MDDAECVAESPNQEWLIQFWSLRAIDAVTVHIEGKNASIVAVPVATQQLAEDLEATHRRRVVLIIRQNDGVEQDLVLNVTEFDFPGRHLVC